MQHTRHLNISATEVTLLLSWQQTPFSIEEKKCSMQQTCFWSQVKQVYIHTHTTNDGFFSFLHHWRPPSACWRVANQHTEEPRSVCVCVWGCTLRPVQTAHGSTRLNGHKTQLAAATVLWKQPRHIYTFLISIPYMLRFSPYICHLGLWTCSDIYIVKGQPSSAPLISLPILCHVR